MDLDDDELRATRELNKKRIKFNCKQQKYSAKQAMILRLEHLIDEELALLKETGSIEEKFEKGNVLFNMHQYLSNYDELEPVLIKYFTEKHDKEKFEDKKDNELMEER